MPKTWLLALPLLLLSATARAGDVGYVDVDRALNECSDGKRVISELQAAQGAREKAKADHEAARVAAAKAKKPAPVALPTDDQFAQQQTAKFNEGMKPIAARMLRILPAIMKARKLSALAPAKSMVYVDPRADVTDELVKRYDRGEGRDAVAAAGQDLKAENAALKAKLAALEKRKGPTPSDLPALPNLDPRAMTATRAAH